MQNSAKSILTQYLREHGFKAVKDAKKFEKKAATLFKGFASEASIICRLCYAGLPAMMLKMWKDADRPEIESFFVRYLRSRLASLADESLLWGVRAWREAIFYFSASADDLYKIGKKLQKEGELEKASSCFSLALEKNPNYTLAYLARGVLKMESGNKNNGWLDIKKASEKPLNQADYYYGLAEAFFLFGFEQEAIQILEQAIELEPAFYAFRIRRLAFLDISTPSHKIAKIDTVYNFKSELIAIRNELEREINTQLILACLLVMWGELESALHILKDWENRIKQNLEEYLYLLASYYSFMCDNYEQNCQILLGLLEARPGNPKYRKALGELYLVNEKVENALEILEQLHSEYPDNFDYGWSLALAYAAAGQIEKETALKARLNELLIK
jgi:tetratricopeptide (TPR) repeat protein